MLKTQLTMYDGKRSSVLPITAKVTKGCYIGVRTFPAHSMSLIFEELLKRLQTV